ncbi:MAG: primosomal protein N' [Syntrophales bacterium]|nr:primosomal protein N' [Syntrophales bacterium]
MFVRVAINIPTDKTFIYSVPGELEKEVTTGKRVLVPFGKRRVTGYILESMDIADREKTKDIIEILDMEPLFNESDLKFYKWASDYYIYHLGKLLGSILPHGIDVESYMWLMPAGESVGNGRGQKLSSVQYRIIEILKDYPKGLPLDKLKKVLGGKQVYRDLKVLQNAKLITIEDRLKKPDIKTKKEKIIALCRDGLSDVKLTEKQGKVVNYLSRHGETSISLLNREIKNVSAVIRSLEKKGVVSVSEMEVYRRPGQGPEIGRDETGLILNKEQKAAVEKIVRSIASGKFSPHLLHGVTGSGKTEVYLNAIEETMKLEGNVIFLVPEIALTPQLLSRVNRRFSNDEIAILHSGISRSARYDQWRRIQSGEIKIVVGARSAIFAPVRNLKLIVVDEEHDTSYKQDDRMPYNARDLAIVKAKLNAAVVVLGSATPGIRTYYNIKEKQYRYLSLPRRVEDKPLPQIEIIDMKDEEDKNGRVPIISRFLRSAIQDTLKAGKQSLLFLNRRGFNTFLCCLDCGHVFRCLNCSVSMTHHAGDGSLKCHYCDYSIKIPHRCPSCHGGKIKSYGVGTEKVEVEVSMFFPQARIERMDSDTTVKKGAHNRLLKALDRGDIDILIGTQMITKGHDFPNITLVGVVSADTSLNIPDFRAAERTFQLITQVSGRSGRGDSPGRVIVQTFSPEHYAIKRARENDYTRFYEDEISLRREMSYPPFSRMVNLRLSSIKKDRIAEGAGSIGVLARKFSGKEVEVIGPAEAPIAKIKGRYRWHILLKGKKVKALHTLARNILTKNGEGGLDIKVDVDPVNFM